MNITFLLLIPMFGGMLAFPFFSFRHEKKRILSFPFLMITLLSACLTLVLYRLTGSARELEHYQLELTIQQLGGIENIIQQIEKRVQEHPEDKEGQRILEKFKKTGSIRPD